MLRLDIGGKRFGRWQVVAEARRDKTRKDGGSGDSYWLCKCACGTEREVYLGNLTRGLSQSCGCLHREVARASHIVHGMAHTKLYGVWSGIITRCTNSRIKAWARYGGRGIKVCARWRSFQNFFKDMSSSYREGLTIDRVDNDGDYTPSNCRWVTPAENSRNRGSKKEMAQC
jgi:hypothetical protein